MSLLFKVLTMDIPEIDKQVSFDNELLILVDENDLEIGNLSKEKCHQGEGKLHRAFSIFLVNSAGKILMQRRSRQKQLWPNYWSNSCCSHPRKGESILQAAHRRLEQELDLQSELLELYQFEYSARYKKVGSERELCTVFVGYSDGPVSVNRNEISEWRWLDPQEIDEWLTCGDKPITPWFQMEWKTLNKDFQDTIRRKLSAQK